MRTEKIRLLQFVVSVFLLSLSLPGLTQESRESVPEVQEPMTNERLQSLIERVDAEYTGQPGYWNLQFYNLPISVITDESANRMRIVIPVRKAEDMSNEELLRVLQANFDTALDARYAVARGILWSTFIHPLSTLSNRDFLSGLGQAVNIVISYGQTYSSGVFSFGGGDSQELLEKKLLEELLEKGEVI